MFNDQRVPNASLHRDRPKPPFALGETQTPRPKSLVCPTQESSIQFWPCPQSQESGVGHSTLPKTCLPTASLVCSFIPSMSTHVQMLDTVDQTLNQMISLPSRIFQPQESSGFSFLLRDQLCRLSFLPSNPKTPLLVSHCHQ